MIKLRRFRPNYDVKNISLWKNINNLKILENNGRPAVFYLVMGEVFDQSQQIKKKMDNFHIQNLFKKYFDENIEK